MNNKKLLKIMELIDERIEALTIKTFEEYARGTSTLTILENCINEVLWDDNSIEDFWKTYLSTTYDGTPKENNIVYNILKKYFFEKLNNWFRQKATNPTLGQLKNITAGMYTCTIETYNTNMKHEICVFKGWMDEISDAHDSQLIDYIRIEYNNNFTNLIINIGATTLTEDNF